MPAVAPEGRSPKRWIIGKPLATAELEGQLLPKRAALPIFASGPLSSVATRLVEDAAERPERPLPGQDRRGEPARPVLRKHLPPKN